MTEGSTSEPIISESLLAILVCPIDKAKVELEDYSLVCTSCGRRYPIVNGIPNMLTDDES